MRYLSCILALIFCAIAAIEQMARPMPVSKNDRATLLRIVATRGLTNVAGMSNSGDYFFTVWSDRIESNSLSFTRTISLKRNNDRSSKRKNPFVVRSDQVQTNFVARVAGQQKWLTLGRETPLDFAQAAITAYLAGNFSDTIRKMEDPANLVGCERATNATNIASLLFVHDGPIPGEVKYHCRFRSNHLTLVTVESSSADTRTIFDGFVVDDHYEPPGFEGKALPGRPGESKPVE